MIKNWRKLMSVFLILALLIAPLTADITYAHKDIDILDLEVENKDKWVIEDFKINGKVLEGFSEEGLEKLKFNKRLVIPEGVETIKAFAFGGRNLEAVTLSSTVKIVKDSAFRKNKIREIHLNNGLEVIGQNAFRNNDLVSIQIPNSIEEIDISSFEENKSETVNSDNKNIAVLEFRDNFKVKQTDIEKQLRDTLTLKCTGHNRLHEIESIESNADDTYIGKFEDLETLQLQFNTEIVDEDTKTENANAWDLNNFKIEGNSILGFSEVGYEKFKNDKDLILPSKNSSNESIKGIGNKAFSDENIESLVLPNNIEIVGERAFSGIKSLKSIDFPTTTKEIKKEAFMISGIEKINLNEGLVTIGSQAFFNNNISSLTIPSSLRNLEYEAFKDNKISKLNIKEGIERIGPHSLRANNFKELIMPDSVKYIDEGGFSYSGIEKIRFSPNLEIIGPKAFCTNNLNNIIVSKNLKQFGPNSFRKNPGYQGNGFYIYIDEVFELDSHLSREEISRYLNKNLGLQMALYRGFIDDESLVYSLEEFKFVKEEGENLIYTAKFKDIPAEDIRPGEGSGNENTKENGKVPTVSVKVKNPEYTSGIWLADDFSYEENTITGLTSSGEEKIKEYKDLIIPLKSIDGLDIKSIGDNAFNKKGLTSIKLSENIVSVGKSAFATNDLEELYLPDSIENLEPGAFTNNKSLKKLKLSSNLKEIPQAAFTGSMIEELHIPKSVEIIGRNAFMKTSIKNLTIPSNVKRIDQSAFSNSEIKRLELTEGLEEINKNAFNKTNIEEIIIPSTVTKLDKAFDKNVIIKHQRILDIINISKTFYLEDKDREEVEKFTNLLDEAKDLNTKGSDDLDRIFAIVEGIEKLIVEMDLVSDLEWKVHDFIFDKNTLIGLSPKGEKKVDYNKNLVIPDKTDNGLDIKIIGKGAFAQKDIEAVKMPDTIEIIEDMAFRLTKIEKLQLPKNLVEIGSGAFANNMNSKYLKEVEFSPNIKVIGQGAFSFTDLEKVIIPEGVIEIGRNAFVNNERMKILELPNTITKIGDRAFKNHGLEEINIPGSIKNIETGTFLSGHLSKVTLNEGTEIIANDAFKKNMIKEVIIPKSVRFIHKNAFKENQGIIIKYSVVEELMDELDGLSDYLKQLNNIDYSELEDIETINNLVNKIREEIDKLRKVEDNKDQNKQEDKSSGDSIVFVPVNPEVEENTDNIFYVDIDNSFWGYKIIKELSRKDIIKGYDDGSFRPNKYMTRGEFAVILDRSFDIPESISNKTFVDVEPNSWYGESIYKLMDIGIVNGYEGGIFRPDEEITREELIKMLVGFLEYRDKKVIESNKTSFKDINSVSKWAKPYILKANNQKLINGYEDNTIRAKNNATRMEVINIIYKAM